MRDVAERVGLSVTTVSLVLGNKALGSIPEATRERIRTAARELGYRPNALARGLRRQTSETIGLVSDIVAATPFAGELIKGAQDAAWDEHHLVLVVDTGGHAPLQATAIDELLGRRVEALILASMYHRIVDVPPALREVPSVLLDARSTEKWVSSVAPDEAGGAFAAIEHLAAAGHRRIGFVQCADDIPATTERLHGYRKALKAAAIRFDASLVEVGPADALGGQRAADALLRKPNRPTALFCFNDQMAMGAYRAARRAGLSIPDDLSVVGFDNMELIAPWLDPPLTTVQLPHYEMGRWAVEHVLNARRGGPATVRHHRVPCPLVTRESVARPPLEVMPAAESDRV